MIRAEAIEILKAYRQRLMDSVSNQLDGDIEAFEIAINSLEVDEMYDLLYEQGADICERWIPVNKSLPTINGKYLVTTADTSNTIHTIEILGYALDLYAVDDYDFADKKGQSGWYDSDREYGYFECDDIIAWMPLPKLYEPKIKK